MNSIPPQLRHDAPDPNRPYVVGSPVYRAMIIVVMVTVVLLYVTLNAFAALAQLSAAVAFVFASPGMFRAPSLRRIDRWAMKRAQRRRDKRRAQYARIDGWFMRAALIPEYSFLLGVVFLVASGLLFIIGAPPKAVAAIGLFLCVWSFLLTFAITLASIMYAQIKGDEAAGPMVFHKAEGIAFYIERHKQLSHEVQLWAGLLACLFAVVAALTAH
jgi:hypothetical protein